MTDGRQGNSARLGRKQTRQKTMPFAFRDLPVGTLVRLRDGSTAEVTGKPARMGAWLLVKIVDPGTDPAQPGAEGNGFSTPTSSGQS